MLHHGDGLEFLRSGMQFDHIITDPDYENQPPVAGYREHCAGNILLFCDPIQRPVGPNPDEVLFWMKPQSTKWSTKRCNRFVEEILVYKGKKNPVFNPIHWSGMTGMFTDGFIVKPPHPYAKPVPMMEKLVLMYTNPGDLVFDPFCGSGTVGVACKLHGRRYIGVEKDIGYFELAQSRM